ncbi:MAG: imidazolonepropionase [Acidobacteriota bacterium]
MIKADLLIRSCHQLLTCQGPVPKRRSELQNVGLLENASIASYRGKIVFVGKNEELNKEVILKDNGMVVDAEGLVGLPGFIDSHTHLPFAGSREKEFSLRLQGYSYQELAQKGLGIQTTVKATRKIPPEELLTTCLSRLDSMLRHGTTTVEAKSGYGLNRNDELKQLEVLRQADKLHPVDIISTFMGAHEIPPEYKNNKGAYLDFLIEKVLPEIKQKNLAEFVDVFCEEGVYNLEESRHLIREARKIGFKSRIHADEFSSLGGGQLAAEEGAASADHLIAITREGIQALAGSNTVATLLPTVTFFLMQEKKAPARKLIDEGAAVALATDFNPGSSHSESMLFALQLAVFTLKMTVEEAINASTVNASYALNREKDVGQLIKGKKMDLLLCDIPHYLHLAYHPGINFIRHVIKNGKLVVKDGLLINKNNNP